MRQGQETFNDKYEHKMPKSCHGVALQKKKKKAFVQSLYIVCAPLAHAQHSATRL